MFISYLLLGSNLNLPLEQLRRAKELLQKNSIHIIAQSKIYHTAAWGNTHQPDFLNMVMQVQSTLTPTDLLLTLKQIEKQMGRPDNYEHWGARIIDIDILYYQNKVIDLQNLHIPHPYLHQRRFTLVPLNDIAPDFIHPKLQQSNKQLLKNCSDTSIVTETNLKL
ncbi:MAG: 2-amino-4-hydroxy-6-hydroxymethyldihydropteridine diphosphokinase [Bacteroidia bacterium]|nr:2-amino-4-hydroxy-6-hydroxymethyldihydropteridine diphosphokinase [Bacteroidia bacterium]MCZ2249376.1 2-amino-4-hydroxy-6-hydroxymethyldihydropteridine diphosphokinase [Bacteroidia bacterium]